MSTTADGREAEALVAKYLENKKHKILSKNWRTRWCEIDLVSTKMKCVYFTEVKYRSSNDWGGGLEYITPKKLKQMKFAAELWLNENNWKNEVILQAAEVDKTGKIYLTEV
jgi:uncharacterized protein (TIGR00252 family)